tara:strand:- start:34 stop:639 length:606 start_codon:yes stop_codon:yes gene_type:complete
MGREFPYTPEGEAAALRYSRAIGMRGGGMMGFRPVGYQEGTGPAGAQLAGVEAQRSDVLAIVSGLMDAMEGSENDVLSYVASNRMDLENIATLPGEQFDIVRNVLSTLQGPGSGVTESPGWDPETREYFPPQSQLAVPAPLPPALPPGMEIAHGGYVGRGTSAGELGRRGDMSVREAGETMYELSKRRHGMKGGGIMSLRR